MILNIATESSFKLQVWKSLFLQVIWNVQCTVWNVFLHILAEVYAIVNKNLGSVKNVQEILDVHDYITQKKWMFKNLCPE